MSAERLREAAECLRVQPLTPYDNDLAEWLDATADRIVAGRDRTHPGGRRNHSWRGSREAVAVADAILGGAR